ncbi:phosphoethanolamine transferase [Comamonas testosteroni]|uniref:phosphoethanolamine transferase n=1 Tax=Comamonas testosteroni TaxID=285 RepID=UPI002DBCA7BB|nr:phosphoethanolamine transferase [Comamonas testosteroni]MEB5966274.1 phosphoethanolamine transferase [Comamonas testosteroni]
MHPTFYWLDMQDRLFKTVLLAAVAMTLFSRPWVAWGISWALCLWWLPISVAVRYVNESPLNASLMGVAMASSPGEWKGLLLSIPTRIVLAMLLWNGLCGAVLYGLWHQRHWRWAGRLRALILLMCVGLLLLPKIIQWSVREPGVAALAKAHGQIQVNDSPFKKGDQAIGTDTDLPRAFPYELPWALAQYWQARQVVEASIASMRDMPAPLSLDQGAPEVVVLVIGESSARKAWGLFNSQLDVQTTPRLLKRMERGEQLLTFSNVVAQSVLTRQAVPSMLSAQPVLWPDGTPNTQATRSILTQMEHAGYRTGWFSNQVAVGEFDGVIAAYADEAQSKAFLNLSDFRSQGSYDEVLVPALRRFLAARDGRTFVVLHTMGSHFRFEHRYPPGFGPFAEPSSAEQAYQNSVAYTDMVLDQVIEALEQNARSAVLLYVSDHGQGIADQRCNRPDTNRVTVDAYEVPALLWLSQAYAQANPDVVAALQANATSPYTAAVVHQTLRDLLASEAAIAAPALIHASSFFRTPPQDASQRVVTADAQWVDFQVAAARNPCSIKAP